MWVTDKLEKLIESVESFLEKGERKIIRSYRAPSAKPLGSADSAGVDHGVKSSDLSFHTGKVRYAPMGTAEKPRDHATYSEHVILHHDKPIGFATVHHAHPSDHGKMSGGGSKATYQDHSVDIHAPGVHPSAHGMLRQKVKDHVNSSEFKRAVDDHNEEKHGYVKPRGWMAGSKDSKQVSGSKTLPSTKKS